MNAVSAEPTPPAEPGRMGTGWAPRKLLFLIALVLAAHLGLIVVFGGKKPVHPPAVGPVPHFQLVDSANELIALYDPTLFALPHQNDDVTPYWMLRPKVNPPSFKWREPAQFLPLAADRLGAALDDFMQTNRFPEVPLNLLPAPALTEVNEPFPSVLPAASTLTVHGALAQRRQLNTVPLPSPAVNDVLDVSRVLATVDPAGFIASVVMLDTSGNLDADQAALQAAKQLRFAPAPQVTFGAITFQWHTVPLATTNAP